MERHDGKVIGATRCLIVHARLVLQISESHSLHASFRPLCLTKSEECSFECILIGGGATKHSLHFRHTFGSNRHECLLHDLGPLLWRQQPEGWPRNVEGLHQGILMSSLQGRMIISER